MHNTLFRPNTIAHASTSASRGCLWVLGMLEAHKWRAGRGHDRLDFLVLDSFDAAKGGWRERRKELSRSKEGIAMRISSQKVQVDGRRVVAAVMGTERDGFALMPISTPSPQSLPLESMASSLRFLRTTDLLPVQLQNVFPKSNSNKKFKWGQHCEFSRQERDAQLMTQRRQMARLASRPHTRLMGNHENLSSGLTETCRGVFICSDGLTTLPYEVLGEASLTTSRHNFVVVHDIFDTLDSTKIFFQRLLYRHPGCQILIYNYSGQAGTTFPTGTSFRTGLHASHLAELLQHVDLRGQLLLSSKPFYLVGVGYGFSICTQLVISHYCEQDLLRSAIYQMLQGLVSVNGTAQIDRQYAAILHALLDSCDRFPKERPDLPISYLSRFQFSDRYLARVHPQLALNIYTAITNPITMQGRAALARGALQNTLNVDLLSRVPLPIFALQSTENVLVTPSNVEVIVRGRITNHVWSHEVRVGAWVGGAYFGARTRATMRGMIESTPENSAGSACVVWVRAGHEIRQEAPGVMLDFFDIITPSTMATSSGPTRSASESTPHVKIVPPGVIAIAGDDRPPSPPKTKNLAEQRKITHLSSSSVLRSEALMTLKHDPKLYNSKATARGGGGEEERMEKSMSHHTDVLEEAPISFGLTFGVSFPNVAMHDFTRSRRYSFFQNVSTSLADAVMHIKVEDVVMRAIYAGSLVVSAHITVGAPYSLDEATIGNTITDALKRTVASSNWATTWGRPAFRPVFRRQENKIGLKHQLPQDSTSTVQNQLSTKTQRQAGLYVDHTDNASTSIEDEEENATRQLIEMQRHVDVDRAEIRLVANKVVPMYQTQPGMQQPVLHPPPVLYKESLLPSSIAHRHDPEAVFSDADIHLSTEPRGQEIVASEKDDIKREMASAQLLREWEIV